MTNSQPDGQIPQGGQTIIINQAGGSRNSVGTAGFVLALLGVALCWIPGLNWVLWILGLILSFVGVFKAPRGLAIAGLCLSIIGLILLLVLLGSLASILSLG
jgi:hypothetical protein